jgi:ATP-dependent Lon protease
VAPPELDIEHLPGADGAIDLGLQRDLPGALPVLPLRETVAFPDTLTPLAVGQERSIKLVNDVLAGNRMLAMVASKDPELEAPGPDQLYEVGVAGLIARMMRVPDGSLRVLVQGAQRVRIVRWAAEKPYLIAAIEEAPDVLVESIELTALMRNVQQTFTAIVEEVPYLPEELQLAVANIDDPSALANLISGALRLKIEEKQELLEEVDVGKRLRRLSEILARELDVISVGTKIQSQVQSELDSSQREYFLRQQLKAIQEELGEADEMVAEANELRDQLDAIDLPEEVRRQADRELQRLERLPPAAAEHGVIRSYLEWIASLPWDKTTEDNLDLEHARKILDEDHYDIEKVKDRILEFLAVRKLKPDARGSILCFVGPPAPSSASASAACATRRRSAVIAARTSAPCPARSSAHCATRGPATPCS